MASNATIQHMRQRSIIWASAGHYSDMEPSLGGFRPVPLKLQHKLVLRPCRFVILVVRCSLPIRISDA